MKAARDIECHSHVQLLNYNVINIACIQNFQQFMNHSLMNLDHASLQDFQR
jgi:hypothetical protein